MGAFRLGHTQHKMKVTEGPADKDNSISFYIFKLTLATYSFLSVIVYQLFPDNGNLKQYKCQENTEMSNIATEYFIYLDLLRASGNTNTVWLKLVLARAGQKISYNNPNTIRYTITHVLRTAYELFMS